MALSPIGSISIMMPGVPDKTFSIPSNVSVDVNVVHPDSLASNTFYEYSGRHDDGELPQLKSSGLMTNVLGCLLEIKRISDQILSATIDQMYGDSSKDELTSDNDLQPQLISTESRSKKMRVEDQDYMEMEQ